MLAICRLSYRRVRVPLSEASRWARFHSNIFRSILPKTWPHCTWFSIKPTGKRRYAWSFTSFKILTMIQLETASEHRVCINKASLDPNKPIEARKWSRNEWGLWEHQGVYMTCTSFSYSLGLLSTFLFNSFSLELSRGTEPIKKVGIRCLDEMIEGRDREIESSKLACDSYALFYSNY